MPELPDPEHIPGVDPALGPGRQGQVQGQPKVPAVGEEVGERKIRSSTVSKNKRPFEKIRPFFNIETQS